jgi:spermidine synthase
VDVLHTERNFFGINKVKLIENGRKVTLIHGTTMHGTEFTDPALRRAPLAYYARSGPVGQLLALTGTRPKVAVIGLGTGALACYRKPGEAWTFYEIDGAVEQIARDTRYFHYLQNCGAGTQIHLGDGRLSLSAVPDRSFDLIVLDAFSSDSIPMHLLTREAVALYLRKLTPHGVVVLHVSNEYLNLVPVLNTVVESLGAAGRHQIYFPSAAESDRGASASEWMAIAAQGADFDFLAPEKRWQGLGMARAGAPWTDDFSNIFRAIKW